MKLSDYSATIKQLKAAILASRYKAAALATDQLQKRTKREELNKLIISQSATDQFADNFFKVSFTLNTLH